MSWKNEHIEKLTAARENATKERRNLAAALSEPYKKGHTENMRVAFIAVQNAIEAIDRALADEQSLADSGPRAFSDD